MSGESEKQKQQQHLSLLKDEYVKLQAYCNELEKKHATLAATYGDCNDKSFVSRLLKTVTTLYNNNLYRCVYRFKKYEFFKNLFTIKNVVLVI